MNKIQIDKARSFVRLDRYLAFWMLVTGATAWAWGYKAGGLREAPARAAVCETVPAPFRAMGTTGAEPGGMMLSEASAAPRGNDDLVKRVVLEFDPRKQPLDDYNQLIVSARGDAALRKRLIQEFETTRDPRVKGRLGTLLTHIGSSDIRLYADGLIQDMDPARRRDGFRILASMDSSRDNDEVRRQLIGALDKETNPEVLNAVISGMAPGAVKPPQETAAVVGRLSELAHHGDASVRAAAVGSLVRWSEGPKVQELIVGALSDSSPQVVAAAMYASAQAGIRTPQVKNQLFQIASQDNADLDFRRTAAGILGSYNLDAQDFQRLMQVRQTLGPVM